MSSSWDNTGKYYDRDRAPNPRFQNGEDRGARQAAGQMNHTYSHHGNVAEYQSSGIPFVASKGSINTNGQAKEVTVNFPYVTRWVMVHVYTTANPNTGAVTDAKVSFGVAGYGASAYCSTYLCGRQRLELKCKKLIIDIPDQSANSTVEVIAGLTGVKDFPSQDVAHVSGITSTTKDGLSVSDGTTPVDFDIFSVA